MVSKNDESVIDLTTLCDPKCAMLNILVSCFENSAQPKSVPSSPSSCTLPCIGHKGKQREEAFYWYLTCRHKKENAGLFQPQDALRLTCPLTIAHPPMRSLRFCGNMSLNKSYRWSGMVSPLLAILWKPGFYQSTCSFI